MVHSDDALKGVPHELCESNSTFKIDANDTIRALGLEWKPNSDRLQIITNTICHASTKREMLSAIGKLFDPLGLISPILTVTKILMQSLWEIKTGWDDPLPDSVLDKWKEFRNSLNNTHELYVPRLVVDVSKNCRYSMFGFCDASEKAYSTCIYIRSVSESSEETTVIICAKARVTPLKKQSIPRLELCSALLLCKLINNVKHAIHIEIDEIRAWSDSMVVLYWRRGVAHLISRGVSPVQLKDNSLWRNGPKWLSYIRPITSEGNLDLEFAEDAIHRAEIEAKQLTAVCNLIVPQLLVSNETINTLITNCSTFTRIERILAYYIRFLHNCRKGHENRELSKLILPPELELSRREVLKHLQRVYFAEELKCLQNKRELSRTSPLLQLSFLDKHGIRMSGRLQGGALEFRKETSHLTARTMQDHTLADRKRASRSTTC
ncbi:PREDICTED: uncharacterized protein LOC105150443 [Acromyrmex echinatior]|uniref:uncharacterized protein LOC105150443 n=1 Tax=Acromyrmex echinatior TaxID=103372 RepID=UPI000580E86D|nr:PREDICTED: uncharacterized protein LOC105150443 [Acromyrmex echinatior]